MFQKVLIANRGEIAVRIARTCRQLGLGTIAVYSDADATALHVEACDEAIHLPGASPADTYLRGDAIIAAARRADADAVHPGYGFLSEDAGFARAVAREGLVWIGPPATAIEAMGDKIIAKDTMAKAAVPLVPGQTIGDLSAARRAADRIGFPLLVKAAAGGGGRGMRSVDSLHDLDEAVASARREAASAFGDDRVFLERLLTRSRHVEVQVLGDHHGQVVHLLERECSVQRRHQKVIEEAPSPGIDDEVRAAMCEAAVAAARAIDYVGAGTVEFIVDEDVMRRRRAGEQVDASEAFAFLEMNTRLQVEHPVTEETVRVEADAEQQPLDLVRWQLLVAAGAPLGFEQSQVRRRGHAIEVRVYAEDPANDYLPSPGRLHQVRWHTPPGVRVDTGVRDGDEISPHYDPMLAKVVAVAPTRDEAAGLLATSLAASTLHGPATNRDLLVATLRDQDFLAGMTTTDFLDQRPTLSSPTSTVRDEDADVAAAVAVVALVRAGEHSWVPTLPVSFTASASVRHRRRVEVAGSERDVTYRQLDAHRWLVMVDERELVLEVRDRADHLTVEVDGHRRGVEVHAEPSAGVAEQRDRRVQVVLPDRRIAVRLLPRFSEVGPLTGEGLTLAPMPGTVVAVRVAEGDEVAAGDLLVVVEAMKMEHRVTASFPGHVTEVRAVEGGRVGADEVLVVVEPVGG